jgi:hypothetical protein
VDSDREIFWMAFSLKMIAIIQASGSSKMAPIAPLNNMGTLPSCIGWLIMAATGTGAQIEMSGGADA